MDYQINHGPAFAMLEMNLVEGEQVQCESGAMVAMSATLTLQSSMGGKTGGGFFGRALSGIARSAMGGESFFVSTYTAENGPGYLALAPAAPGDVREVEMDGHTLVVQGGSFLASSPGIVLDTAYSGMHAMIGGEGMFVLKASGTGTLFLSSFGGISRRDLAPGERFIVDSGHMVAYAEGMGMQTRMVAGAGGFFKRAFTSATSGEGLVMEFTGPGPVWIQTRNADAFAGWVKTLLPELRNTSSGQ